MKKILSLVVAVFLVSSVPSFAFAEEEKSDETMPMMSKMKEMKGMMAKCGSKMSETDQMMKGMKCGMMMGRSLVALKDGGVVVLSGSKLTKFDKNLNLVKEVGLKMDMTGMQKMMAQMMKECPMRQKMMKKGGMKEETAEKTEGSGASQEMSGHESHH